MAIQPQVPDAIGNSKFPYLSNVETGIVAKAGGGQANAYQLGAQINRVDTVASGNDSVRLPKIVPGAPSLGLLSKTGATVGTIILITNNAANSLQVFGGVQGAVGDTINAVATGTGVAQGANVSTFYVAQSYNASTKVGTWVSCQTLTGSVAAITSGTISGVVVSTSTFDNITASGATLGILGLNAAQGGTVNVTGGTSSTAGNAGGPVNITGGTPGSTSAGGAVVIAGAAGGSGSGAGGAVSLTGGAGTAGNATGGTAQVAGGAGQGTANGATATLIGGQSGGGATGNGGAAQVTGGAAVSTAGNGGAVTIAGGVGTTSGAGGAVNITSGNGGNTTGAAGAINITVGTATGANGSSVTITAGNGAGGTNAGGNVNVVPGTAVSTGIPGEFQVNGSSHLIPVVLNSIGVLEVVTRVVFTCTRAMIFKAVSLSFATASSSGTMQVEKLTGTTVPGSGTALLTGTMSMAGTVNTVVNGTLIATIASLKFAVGDRVGLVFAGTMTGLVGFNATLLFAPL